MTVPLLRLMIAVDDLRHLQKLLILTRDHDGAAGTESDTLIHNGELGHLFRLLCGHLYEAAIPFRGVDRTCRGRLDAAVEKDADSRDALAAIRAAYEPGRTDGLRHSFLYLIRKKLRFTTKIKSCERRLRSIFKMEVCPILL
jgi:hypothetical protein